MRGGTLLILGQRSRSNLSLCLSNLVGTIQATVFAQSLSNFSCKLFMMRRGILLTLGQSSRSNLVVCLCHLVDTTQTSVFAQLLSNFTRELFMMKGGILLIWCHGVKGQGKLGRSVYKTLWAWYRLQFEFNHFQTSHVSYGWWEEEPYWFWVTGLKVEVNSGILCKRPCGHDTDSFCPITFKINMSVVMGSNFKVNFASPPAEGCHTLRCLVFMFILC